ncbi:MAG: HNH endonuclease signature motif containing protein [Proteobacteria bacterium]|nr:HNH endonuclease signature motif containing protein [Pseudomonadota bacterium]
MHLREDAHGNVLDLGRKRRTVSAAQKRALATRDPQCQFPGCPHRAFLEPHHIVHWQDGGETNLSNLVRLCSFHHVCLHEGGYRVELGANRQSHRFFDREGRRIHVVPTPPRDIAGFESIVAMNHDLAIDRATNAPQWNGSPVDHHELIRDLCWLEDQLN